MLQYLQQAVALVASFAKSEFTTVAVVPTDPSGITPLPDGMDDFVRVVGLRRVSVDAADQLRRPSTGGEVTAYGYDQRTPHLVYTYPVGASGTIRIAGFVVPTVTSMDTPITFPRELEPALMEFVCYYALVAERDAPSNKGQAQAYWDRGMKLLQVDAAVPAETTTSNAKSK